MEFLKATPKWLIILLAFYITVLFSYAIFDGRSVTFWPPAIGQKESNKDVKIKVIKDATAITKETFSPQDLIENLPADIQRFTIKDTANEILKRLKLISTQKLEISALKPTSDAFQFGRKFSTV